MKITKRQLKRIIKEEKAKLISEQSQSEQGASEAADRAIMDLFEVYIDRHLDGVGSNEEEAIYLAARDLQEFFGGYSDRELENNYSIDTAKFGV